MTPIARLPVILLLAALAAWPVPAQEGPPDAATAEAEPRPGPRLPEAATTQHEIEIGDASLAFTAVAGALTIRSAQERPEADIAYVAYTVEPGGGAERPVTFAVNGGPGAASAYLHLGALGPWRLPLDGDAISPSRPVALEPNAETWLTFTDLVFVDPVGTGFSRLVEPGEGLRSRYLSVDGDVAALGAFISNWLTENGRRTSPAWFVGESYGGFRGPLLAEALQTDHGVGLAGMTLVSPVLDFGWWQQPAHAPLPAVSLLPSLAAARMEREGDYSAQALEAAESYAATGFVADWLRGPGDARAAARMIESVASLTGLPRETVARASGRIDRQTFTREAFREEGRIASAYDASIASRDPSPGASVPRAADPVLDAMTAPLTSAMLALHADRLGWLPDRRYMLLNRGVNRAWTWGRGRGQPEAVGALGRVLALDQNFRLLVVHGTTDLVTPYFASTLILRQLPDFGGRVAQSNFRGGHMFYTREDSRRALRDDARRLYGGHGLPTLGSRQHADK